MHRRLFLSIIVAGATLVGLPAVAAEPSDLLPGMDRMLLRAGPTSAAPGQTEGPQVRRLVVPPYPMEAHAAAMEGRVGVCFDVDETGTVVDPIIVLSSADVFEEPALEAINKSRFLPARLDDIPVRSHLCRTYRFILE